MVFDTCSVKVRSSRSFGFSSKTWKKVGSPTLRSKCFSPAMIEPNSVYIAGLNASRFYNRYSCSVILIIWGWMHLSRTAATREELAMLLLSVLPGLDSRLPLLLLLCVQTFCTGTFITDDCSANYRFLRCLKAAIRLSFLSSSIVTFISSKMSSSDLLAALAESPSGSCYSLILRCRLSLARTFFTVVGFSVWLFTRARIYGLTNLPECLTTRVTVPIFCHMTVSYKVAS